MTKEQKPAGIHGKGLSENGEKGGRKKIEADEDTCRCKEVSKKNAPEMFKLMLSDLSFWKKAGKGK